MSDAFDPLSPAFAADPYAAYARLRAMPEPPFHEGLGMVLLSRFADVAAVATNPAMVRSLDGIAIPEELEARQIVDNFHDMPFHERFVQTSLLDSDGPTHRRLRKQVFGAFRETSLARLELAIARHVNAVIAPLIDAGPADFVEAIAAQIPGHAIGLFLGVPAEDAPLLRHWSEDVVRYFDVGRTAERKARAETATREFHDYLVALKLDREHHPQDDLISRMVEAERQGHYTGDELISTAMLILMAGHGSTIDALSSGMHLLLKHPQAVTTLRSQPARLPDAIQEMFRFEPPLPFFHRHATREVEIGGLSYPAGTTFGLLYASANRDSEAFDDPDTFDIARTPNRHLAFGLGAHLCLGNALARINMRQAFEALLAHDIQLVEPDVRYKLGLSVRGPEQLMVEITPQS